FQINDWQGGIFRDGDDSPLAKTCPQAADDEAKIAKSIHVDLKGTQAPVIVRVPCAAEMNLVGKKTFRLLHLLRPKKHPFMPVDRPDGHEVISSCGADRKPEGEALP